MREKLWGGMGASLVVLSLLLFAGTPVFAQGAGRPALPNLIQADVSPPLRSIPPVPLPAMRREIPNRPIPRGVSQGQTDPVVQTSAVPLLATTSGLNFDGVGEGAYGSSVNVAPPDTNGAVGETQYVQWVNLSFAVFDKATGTLLYGPAAGNTVWQGSSLTDCATTNDGDPIIQYDKAAKRWIFAQLSYSNAPPYYECIAVSATSDATGPYYRYALQWTSSTLPDYPKLGVWPDGYYLTFNMFFGGFFFTGPQVCALDRSLMLVNGNATAQCVQLGSSYSSLLPADLDGSTAPAAGSPEFFLSLGSNALQLWKYHVDWANTANTSFTGPQNIGVAAFNEACGGGTCIPQLGTTQQLDSLGDRLMYRLAYRNFGSYDVLLATHSVNPGGGGRGKPHLHEPAKPGGGGGGGGNGVASAVRWYELRNPGGSVSVFQQGSYAPDTNSRWMGSIAMDKVGNIALGYSVSSGSINPSIRYAGRVPSDPLGTLQAENVIMDGTGSQLPTLSRWGDYSSISVDPVDDCTFWYTNEYLKTSGTFNWNTRIASFKFPSCQ